ncbi:DUF3496 domain-containing protein [Aliarcobacter butzleri]|uniref:DUF3496 domain-containing protein n=1 Tax=Aliarcobacter butzleri TaxID=28197 RepID=UPI000DB64A24|nr:DUF3496 domain-containing protein [Aliarcobacter butzleri]MCG3665462.1 DUF3496 domain-containing protein [Aliarcobacter butzleri]PZQ08322.1 MAG: hypothetical protein DI567_02770 [Aliarcobacter butzleri]
MGEIMQKEEFLKTITKEELYDMWAKAEFRVKDIQDELRKIKSSNKHLELELEKFQRWYYEEKKKNEHTNS